MISLFWCLWKEEQKGYVLLLLWERKSLAPLLSMVTPDY